MFSALPDVVNDSSGDPVNDTLWNNSGSNSVVIECSTKSNTWQPNVHPFAHRTQQRYTNKTTTNRTTKKSSYQNSNNNLNNSAQGVVVQVNNNNNNQCSSYARATTPVIDNELESLEDSFEKIIRSADHRYVQYFPRFLKCKAV